MPGRPSTRASIASNLSRKPSHRHSRHTPSSSLIPEESPPNELRTKICNIFGDAQHATTGHRKLVISLRKVQEACVYEHVGPKFKFRHNARTGEDGFREEIMRSIVRVMNIKKSEPVGDRLVRFMGLFLKYAGEQDAPSIEQSVIEHSYSTVETPTARLVTHTLSTLNQFMTSKEKTVRYRATQLVAHIINSVDTIDDEYYQLLKTTLLRRIRDREPIIRVQAVIGLGRLAGNEDDNEEDADSDEDIENGLVGRLVHSLQNDPSADVRRALLLNLPLTPNTLPYLLERARDLDSGTRRALYSRLLPALGDFRHLSLSMREKLLRWGLRDRDENVRKATIKLFRERWIEDCARSKDHPESDKQGEVEAPSLDALLELLERIDIVNSGNEHGIGGEAMRGFWEGRPDYQSGLAFEEPFWDNLTPESVFTVRTWNDFYHSKLNNEQDVRIEGKLPEVTRMAFCLEHYIHKTIQSLRKNALIAEDAEVEESVEQEFVVEQLLYVAKTMDYTDEVGRRKMFALLRETLAIAELPDEITQLVIDVLREICGSGTAGERDFCGIVLEAIAEVHDNIIAEDPRHDNGDESFHSARSEISNQTPTKALSLQLEKKDQNDDEEERKAIQEIMINMKCLHIAQCMLQNVEGALQANMHLVTMLNNLVIPAVRSQEAPVRERGLLCLGLCCLLDKNLANENLTLFLHCFSKGHDALQISAIQTVADVLETHSSLFTGPDVDPNLRKSVIKMFSKGIKSNESRDVQSVAITALCKLLLMNVIEDEDLLKQAVVLFFDPTTSDNTGMRQALSYSIPVYCFSKRENMERMARVAGNVIHAVVDIGQEVGDEEEVVGLSKVSNVLAEWTDARKLVIPDGSATSWSEETERGARQVNSDPHLTLAETVLEKVLHHSCSKEDRRALLSMLGKLHISPGSTVRKLQVVRDLIEEAIDNRVAGEATSRTALNKLHTALDKARGDLKKSKLRPTDELPEQRVTDEGESAINGQDEGNTEVVTQEEVTVESVVGGDGGTEDSLLDKLLDDNEML